MLLTENQIIEIAESLDSGMLCFHHKITGAIEFYPDPDDTFFESEYWQEIIDKVENDFDNYDQFVAMGSTQSFRLMEGFAESIPDLRFKVRLLENLSRRKPFQNFKRLIDPSRYRQEWFDFKKQAYIDWVKKQIPS